MGAEDPAASAEEDLRMRTEESSVARRDRIRGLQHPGRVRLPVSLVSLESPVSQEREPQERTVRAAPSVTTEGMRIDERTTMSPER